jgi:hypothetical protein
MFKNRNRHAFLSPQWLFVRVMSLLFIFFAWRVLRWPIEKYQDWEDPLKPQGTGGKESVLLGTEEDIRERLRYKRRVKDW